MEGDKRNLSFDSDKNPNGALPGEAAPEECEDSLVAVSRVSAAISGLGNLEEILEIRLDTTLQFMHGSAGGIMLLDEEEGVLSYRVTRNL